jgi:RND superfamily putative drug exporter
LEAGPFCRRLDRDLANPDSEDSMKTKKKGIAERVGHWSATHRKTAIFGWIAFVAIALVGGSVIGTNQLTDAEATVGEAGVAARVLSDSGLAPAQEMVLVQSDSLTTGDAAFRDAVTDVSSSLRNTEDVRAVQSPLQQGGAVSEDGHAALVQFEIAGDPDTAVDRIAPSQAAVEGAAERNPELRVEQFGYASAGEAINTIVADDLRQAETLSLPVTLLILLLAFGSLVAAGVPLLLGISAVMATFGLIALPSQLLPVDEGVASIILLVGLAVGVDYSLFYMRRVREERRSGRSSAESLRVASATSGRAVLISGLTVIIAMAGMFFTGDATFISMGIGTILVVAVAMAASITVLPAILAALGDRVEKGRVPFLWRYVEGRRQRNQGVWKSMIDRVMKRPAVSFVLALGVMVALAAPALGMKTEIGGTEQLSRDIPIVQTYDRIDAAFPGENIPAEIVVQADDVTSPAVRGAIDRLVSDSASTPGVLGAPEVMVNEDSTVASITVPIAGTGSDDESKRALASIREDLIPASFDGVEGTEISVGGQTAETSDFNDRMHERLPLVFVFVLGLAFILMLVTFRSIVIPLKAIALNLLSVGAAYGVLTLVFQHGLGSDLLGFETPGSVAAWLPLFLFVILFGLSMDYHVLILSRVREGVDRGMSTEDAVREGITSTASTVTSAAFVMVAVFSIFATLSLLDLKEMGVGLAVAILIDATIVRAVLLPSSMSLLGKWNWYLPDSLEWLPRFRHEVEVEVELEPATT